MSATNCRTCNTVLTADNNYRFGQPGQYRECRACVRALRASSNRVTHTAPALDVTALRYGVEIECVGIDQQQAAFAVQSVVGGVVDSARGVVATDGRVWLCERDGSLYCAQTGRSAEVVSPILTASDMDTLQAVVRALRAAGGQVNSSCGLHVHVGTEALDWRAVRALACKMAETQDALLYACSVSPSRYERYARKLVGETRTAIQLSDSASALRTAWYGCARPQVARKYEPSRYHALNLHSYWFRGTVEFRLFNGTLHAGKVKAAVQFAVAMVAWAANHRSATTINAPSEYASTADHRAQFVATLDAIGLTGPEHATARLHLTRRWDEGDDASVA